MSTIPTPQGPVPPVTPMGDPDEDPNASSPASRIPMILTRTTRTSTRTRSQNPTPTRTLTNNFPAGPDADSRSSSDYVHPPVTRAPGICPGNASMLGTRMVAARTIRTGLIITWTIRT
ncbi:hypothetical protein GCM10009804_59400 [Kribbella hippodromi]|uniref:Uncharacterized protein n=1 Tax=Kribbella hippodromi TaxID=434347 RepID=A0ABN2E4M0_9ACTN